MSNQGGTMIKTRDEEKKGGLSGSSDTLVLTLFRLYPAICRIYLTQDARDQVAKRDRLWELYRRHTLSKWPGPK